MTKSLSAEDLRAELQLLAGAKELIASGSEEFLCLALEKARLNVDPLGLVGWEARTRLEAWIESVIQSHEVYTDWVEEQFQETYPGWQLRDTPEHKLAARSARLRWIDWMIGEINREIDQLEACSADALGSWSRTRTTAPDRSS